MIQTSPLAAAARDMMITPLVQSMLVGAGMLSLAWGLGILLRRAAAHAGSTAYGGPAGAPALPPAQPRFDAIAVALAAADLVAVVLCVFGAFVLRLDWFFVRSPELTSAFQVALFGAQALKPPIFYAFGLYRRYWRYAGVRDLVILVLAVSAGSLALAVAVTVGVLSGTIDAFPRSILAIDWLLTLGCVASLRLSVRAASERRSGSRPGVGHAHRPRRVLIAGAGDTGALMVREMQRNPQLGLDPVAFLDDHPAKRGKRIHQVPVVGGLPDLEQAVVAHHVDEVVIAMPTAEGALVRQVVEACQRAGVASRAVPGVFELLDGGVSVSRLREIDIADLLRRAQVPTRADVGAYLQGQVVLVSGAGGSIGFELCRQVARAGASEIVLVGHGENAIFESLHRLRAGHPAVRLHGVIADVRHPGRIRAVLARHRPAVVFHAAAHKHVPLMEAQPDEAVANNVQGTRSLVDAAIAVGVRRFVLISTDKAVAPSSVMGATKRVAELIVREAARVHHRAFAVVRFGNVLGSRGSVVPLFKEQIERGGPVTVTHPEMTRFFMTIPEAVYLVLKAGGLAVGGELFVLNMGEPVRILDLTRDLIRLSGFTGDEIPIVYTGLRPGEKLHEALWEPDATCEPAGGDDVWRVVERGDALAGLVLRRRVDELIAAADRGETDTIQALLGEIVSTYAPPRPEPALLASGTDGRGPV